MKKGLLVLLSLLASIGIMLYPTKVSAAEANAIESGQINFVASIPDGFGLNLYVTIGDNETGEEWQVPLYATNNYTNNIQLPQGSYRIYQFNVYDDNKNQYPISYDTEDEDIELKAGDVVVINAKLTHEAEIIEEINKRKAANEVVKTPESTEPEKVPVIETTKPEATPLPEEVEVKNNDEMSNLIYALIAVGIVVIVVIVVLLTGKKKKDEYNIKK